MSNDQNIQTIIASVMTLKNRKEVDRIWDACTVRNGQLSEVMALSFTKGQKVEFDYKNKVTSGIVEKINRKTIVVTVKNGESVVKWKVHPSLLRIAN